MRDIFSHWEDSGFEREIAPGHMGRQATNRALRKHVVALGVLAIGRHVCFKKDAAPAPTPDPAIGQSALESAQLGKDWLTFAREQFDAAGNRQDVTDALTNKVINRQLEVQDQANQWATEDRDRTKSVFQPLQDEFIKTAKEYDTPEKQDAAAAEAKAAIERAGASAQQANSRTMASMGISPNSGRFQGMQRAATTDIALAKAGAGTAARQMVRDKAIALKGDAINLGNGLPSSAAAAYGIGNNSGNSAVGNNATGNANFAAGTSIMANGFSGAMQGTGQQGSILNNLYGSQLQGWGMQNQANAQQSSGIGSMIGSLAGTGAALYM